ncbi:hypothetical protein ACH5RR_029201 [Cinchona calisaya]|uniref:Dirigent protein n=1 Tax=Cinchona calisaya TaxID=153742 RepID=A0ABD2YUV5_9GENT
MAKVLAPTTLHFFMVLLISILVYSEANCCPSREIKITVFLQQFTGGPNATTAAVAGIPSRPRDTFQFGTIFVADAGITEGININSPQVGRGQGIYATSSLDGLNGHNVFSFVFTNRRYNGSTSEFQGRGYSQGVRVSELSVVEGTGAFRFVEGYATFATVLQRPSINYTVDRVDITLRQY